MTRKKRFVDYKCCGTKGLFKLLYKMTTLHMNFPVRSQNEYKVVQVEMDGAAYLWFNSNIEPMGPLGCGHAATLGALLEKEGQRFGLYKYLGNKPFRVSENRFATDDDLGRIRIYHTIPDKLDPKNPDLSPVPALQGDGYIVLGAGKVDLDLEEKAAHFHGRSLSYEIGLHAQHLELFRQAKPDWRIFHTEGE